MSFRLKTILGIALIEAVLLFILIFSSLNFLRTSNQEELHKRAYTTARLFATTVQNAVLATDLASLESFIHEVLTNPGVVYARVLGREVVFAEGGDSKALAQPFRADNHIEDATDNIFDAYADIDVQGVKYGKVEIGLSVGAIKNVLNEARAQIMTIAAVEMGLVALFSFFLGLYLTRGLDALKEGARHLSEGELGYQIEARGKDELARTARAFNEMSHKLKTASEVHRRAKAEIVKLNQELEERVARRTRELAALNKELEHQALHDDLTKLANRTLFSDRLDHAIQFGRREKRPFTLVIIDLDRFKEINDTKGHHVGDLVLQQVALRLPQALRESDTVARMGGDEFALLLPSVADPKAVQASAEKILRVLSPPMSIAGDTIELGASLGIALFPEHGTDAETLMRRADAAMYHAKFTHGGFGLFREDLEHLSQERYANQSELRRAIENGELVLHYQPKISLDTQTVSGVEALVRWQHPRQGLLFPDSFIPLAEQTGLVKPLTLAVLHMAARQGADWQRQGVDLSIAVNISPQNLQDEQFPEHVAEVLKKYRLPPGCLELEITETGIMTNPVLAIETVRKLGSMGLQIAIDDFGTGYSSMAYLQRLLIAKIKIDKSFVINMTKNKGDAVIVRSTIDLGHNLGFRVIAEGVEDQATWRELKVLGCDDAQGYYMSKPLPAEELTDWLNQSPWGTRSK